jgi:hypothetical protein
MYIFSYQKAFILEYELSLAVGVREVLNFLGLTFGVESICIDQA